MDRPVRLTWEGLVFNELSLARVNREILARLVERDDVHVTLRSDAATSFDAAKSGRILARLAPPGSATPDVFVRHLWPPNFERPQTQRYVHCQPWEFGAIPRAWADGIAAGVDEVWCWSTYVLSMYVDAGVPPERCVLVPHGVDPAIFRPEGARVALPTSKRFVFLFLGGAIPRKGADVAVNAFLRAFRRSDDVALVVKDVGTTTVYAHMTVKEQIIAASRNPDAPEILYSEDVLDDAGVAALYRTADVLLLPYRGEGFGLPALEAMACGTPALVTAGGATDDFVSDFTGWRIPAKRTPVGRTFGDLELVDEGWMLEPDADALVATLRRLYEQRDEVRRRAGAASASARLWTWDRAAAIVADRLRAAVLETAP